VAVPARKGAVPVVLEIAPDRRRRLSDGALVEASIAARLLGLRILTLDATVALVPADVTAATPAVQERAVHTPTRPSGDSRGRAGPVGHGLADAVRNLDEGATVLAEVRRNGRLKRARSTPTLRK
jgi:hypothetical protein